MGMNYADGVRESYETAINPTDEAFAMLCLEDRWELWVKIAEKRIEEEGNDGTRALLCGDEDDCIILLTTTTFAALTRQLDIGWFLAFMCRYITTPLIKCQHHSYYRSIDSHKHGISYDHQLSSKLLNLTQSIWIHRNSVLHETSTIHELSGLATLRLSITAEYNLGRGYLPMPYSPFFYSTLLPS